jgi:hypothetical protein
MRVSDCHLNRFVAHEFLHGSQINTSHYKPTREGVTQAMPCKPLQASLLYGWIKPLSRRYQALRISVQEDPRLTI